MARTKNDATRRPVPTGTDVHQAVDLLRAGKKEECRVCVRALDSGGETNYVTCNLAGLLSLSLDEYLMALQWFDRALAIYPAYLDALANRGVAPQQIDRHPEAPYDEAIRWGAPNLNFSIIAATSCADRDCLLKPLLLTISRCVSSLPTRKPCAQMVSSFVISDTMRARWNS